MKIGEAIRATRIQKSRTQESVAFDVGFNPGNLSRLELGWQSVSLDRFIKICSVLGVKASDVFLMMEAPAISEERAVQEARTAYSPEILAMNQAYEALDAPHQVIVLRLIEDLANAQRLAK